MPSSNALARTLGLAAALACSLPALAEKAEPLHATFNADVSVDASGHVSDVTFRGKELPEPIRAPLERDIRRWEFEPAKRGEQPVASLTHVWIKVVAEPADGDPDSYALRITAADNGPASAHLEPPRYPHVALQTRADAKVIVEVDIAPDGHVADARVHSVVSSNSRVADAFGKASLTAVRNWTFLPEQIEGQPIAATVKIPFSYCIEPCKTREAEPKDEPQPVAEHPVAQLRTEVTGRLL